MVDVFRNGELEADVIEEIRENYDLIANEEPTSYQEEKEYDMAMWIGEMEGNLELLGIKYDLSGIDIPEDRKERLFKEYFAQTIDFDDKGNVITNLPMIDKEKIVGNTPDELLFSCGELFGSQEELGDYYRLLSLLPFAKGYWYGKFSNAVLEDDDSKILDVSREIKVFDPDHAEEYLGEIVDTCFKEEKEKPRNNTGFPRR